MSDHEITDAMITYGGSFVQALGRLFRLADPQNQARLKAAFPDYWIEYADLARRRGRRYLQELDKIEQIERGGA